jgi:hypothetical protein
VAGRSVAVATLLVATFLLPESAWTQTLSQRGFVEGRGIWFVDTVPNDRETVVGDVLVREELFLKVARWLQFAGGVDLRANSHHQVDDQWKLDFDDRTLRRPPLSVRRLAATLTFGRLTIDAGKQFFRWGKADILNPTDRFAPRDYLNVVDTEFLAVTGVRVVLQVSSLGTVEAVWVPRLTPSRMPLLDQRWTVLPKESKGTTIVDGGAEFSKRGQVGVRWNHPGRFEYSLSYFDGLNHEPNIQYSLPAGVEVPVGTIPAGAVPSTTVLTRVYPQIRSYGADAALPTPWFTVKGEAAYFTSDSPATDEYLLYVVQIERQKGEWVFVGGYAGEVVIVARTPTVRGAPLRFAPDRGLTRSVVARVSYNIDTNRSFAIETDVRQNLDGAYLKAEYSQAYGQHWRMTASGALIRGQDDDFLGQYHRNSHVSIGLRFSF